MQFKYKHGPDVVTSSYLKKTIKKFAETLRELRSKAQGESVEEKLSFAFVTNADFSDDLWSAVRCLKSGKTPQEMGAKRQFQYLKKWCDEEGVAAEDIFPLIEFRAATSDLPAQNRSLRRTVSDWSADSAGQAAKRLFALVELIREKAQIEGQNNNAIRREDVLDALECDEDLLFPADTRFVDVGDVVERIALRTVEDRVLSSDRPIFLHADGGVGKTVFIQSLATHLADKFETVVFDCFGGGAYRYEGQARHLPRVGLLQIVNELATRGLCDPLLPTDSDQQGLIHAARKRLEQASRTAKDQSSQQGVLIILDAADNAQIEADARNELAFPKLLLSSLSADPIDGVKLLLTARPHRMDGVIGRSQVERLALEPFTDEETRIFLETRRENITDLEFSTAIARSQGNARVLEYLVESWDANVSGDPPQTQISVEELIAQKCEKIFRDLDTAGWSAVEIREFFAALSLLPPPIPLTELAEALGWSGSQVNSAASDLAPMLELVKHGAIFRDEPTETYIKDHYASEAAAQQSIAERLKARQEGSMYAAEALPHFLVVIGDSDRAYQLASSDKFPAVIETEYGKRRLRLVRLYAAFSLATREQNLNRILKLMMQLSQVASANARGDEFIRRSPALATAIGDSDASRRLFHDRSGWRGGRDSRLVVAYSFSDDLDEARIHQNRAIGWINWYLKNDDEDQRINRSGFEASDVAAVMFLNVLENSFSSFNRNIQLWNFKFALSVVEKLLELCAIHELSNGSEALDNLTKFAASKKCQSLALQIGLLSKEWGLTTGQIKSVSRAASSLAERYRKKVPELPTDYEMTLQGAIGSAAMSSVAINSKQSAKRLLKLYHHRRPSSYDYGQRYGSRTIWKPVQSACVSAWSSGKRLSLHDLLPEDAKPKRGAKPIVTEDELGAFLDSLVDTVPANNRRKGQKPERRKRFARHDRDAIVEGAACILELVKPIEDMVLSRKPFSNDVLADFLAIWAAKLRPDVHWRAETGKDSLIRDVGIGLVKILLRHNKSVHKKEAKELLKIISENRFSLTDKIEIHALVARRANLADIAGSYANSLSAEIVKDDYIEQRGESYRDLASALVPLSLAEAREYYAQGLAQLDQMGSNDYDLIYSALRYAAEQPGGQLSPALSHRLMNLCQTIFQGEPSKFGWTLFGRAASSSIGFPAMYKLIRWHDQDVVDYSYGLPQLVCYLAKDGCIDPRRAAVLLTICEDHGWHEWKVGEGLRDILSAADPDDRAAVFSLVVEKLESEHAFGGWVGVWEGLLDCIDAFEDIGSTEFSDRFRGLRDAAKVQRDLANARNNYSYSAKPRRMQTRKMELAEKAKDDILAETVARCEPTSAVSIDEAIRSIEAMDGLYYDNKKRLLADLQEACPFGDRLKFLQALCESTELTFDAVLDLLIERVKEWSNSAAHVGAAVPVLIKKLFAFKGSEFFDLRYSGISRQIHGLSELSGDPDFVMKIVLETIAKERLELSGDEWLKLATSLSRHTDPTTALGAFEDLLVSSAAKVGDEIGEGEFRPEFAGKSEEADVVADIIWHLLGDGDAFIRWHAARCLKGLLDVGLIEDIEHLLKRYDVEQNSSLSSDEHHFSYMNAQQWLLIGLARAALHHGDMLKPLKPRIEKLAQRSDIHVLNKLALVRCLGHIDGDQPLCPSLAQLYSEVQAPKHGIEVRDGWPESRDRRHKFGFDYEFNKYKIPELARLFHISDNEANDLIADEVVSRWPKSKSMSDFPGGVSHQRDSKFETYREHVQKHAQLHAATRLAATRPVVRSKHDWEKRNPWQEFLRGSDVSFEDGSWLSDHKDRVPMPAREYLLGERIQDQEYLLEKEALFQKTGFCGSAKLGFFPLFGHWKSRDGVHVRFSSALIKTWGAVGQCAKFARVSDHDLWLPFFGSDGLVDRFAASSPFEPLIWEPEKYPIGIDEHDEWAARGAIARPKLGGR